ncbi:MAG TPA: glycoside hydrolase family 3 C-terminal domain-containing protein [Pyrinomonadaceae bacterium]|jgi:beta-glucosidase
MKKMKRVATAIIFLCAMSIGIHPQSVELSEYPALLEEFNSGKRDPDFLRMLARMARTLKDESNATRVSSVYSATIKEVNTTENIEFLREFTQSSKDQGFNLFYRDGNRINQIMGYSDYSQRVVDDIVQKEEIHPLLFPSGQPGASEPDWSAIATTITRKYDAKLAARAVLRTKVRWYVYKKNWPQFTKNLVAWTNKYGVDTNNNLNNTAWQIFERSTDKMELTTAASWMKERVLVRAPGDPNLIDTYANLIYKAGLVPDGITWEEKAVNIANEKNLESKGYQNTIDKMKRGEPTWPISSDHTQLEWFLVAELKPEAANLFLSSIQTESEGGAANPEYLNPGAPIDRRIDDLVSRMTLEEKASQVVNVAAAIPRLKVPAYNWWSEALHGVVSGTATVFPEPIGLAATFDTPLIKNMAIAIGTEARAKHHELVRRGIFDDVGLDFWSPNLNIFRDPRWGRGQETYGEDPFLTSQMGVAYVTGMQGDDPKYRRVVATPKHFAVHSGPEPLRHTFNANVSKYDLEDTYLPAFRAAIVDGKADSIMCVYNSVNGEPGCANSFLLENRLREKWKFQGYVVSDCGAIDDIWSGHHYTKTLPEAAAISMKRGTDLDCNFDKNGSIYVDAVKQGLLKESELDASVKRLMRARIELGMFDPPENVEYAKTPFSANDSEQNRQLALKVARESMVLLKNDGILPLNPRVRKVAVVGPLADQIKPLLGNYYGIPTRATTVLRGIQKQFPGASVTFSPGTRFLRTQNLVPLPQSVLLTENGQQGLKAEYFKGTKLEGVPSVERIDKQINFDFAGGDTVPEVGKENFSARWNGSIIPQVTGTYQLGVTGDDGYRLLLDGKILADDWGSHNPSTKTQEVKLQKGQKYAVTLEYFQAGGGAVAKLVWSLPDEDVLEEALAAAKAADVVVAVVGITSDLEGEEMKVDLPGFKGGDRTSLDLPAQEEELLKALKATGKPLVVVLMNGSALSVNWAQANANAILEAWYPGEEGGTAVGETLVGANNPAGRLPVTFYKSVDQLPPFEDYSMRQRTYRYFSGEPLYPFGYGLSYSSFGYSKLKLSAKKLKAGDNLEVDVNVKNTSTRDGDEVVQVYLTFPPFPGAPIRALRGFSRIHLRGGETQHVHFRLSPRDLSSVNEVGDRLVVPGSYQISVGSGQPGTNVPMVQDTFFLRGELKLPE